MPTIDMTATGKNITRMMKAAGMKHGGAHPPSPTYGSMV